MIIKKAVIAVASILMVLKKKGFQNKDISILGGIVYIRNIIVRMRWFTEKAAI